jgi:hemerythrin-like domain-containing protein
LHQQKLNPLKRQLILVTQQEGEQPGLFELEETIDKTLISQKQLVDKVLAGTMSFEDAIHEEIETFHQNLFDQQLSTMSHQPSIETQSTENLESNLVSSETLYKDYTNLKAKIETVFTRYLKISP